MSSDRSAVACERLAPSQPSPASGGGLGWRDRPPAAAPACDLAELASALARVEALLTAGADESPDAAAAVERIADIAFVLHEREVEPSLCDALDAAMRDISEVEARNRASVQRAHEAVELLRALARRLDAMMAARAQLQASQSAAYGDELECADEFPAPARLFDADLAEDGAFAQTIAALAESPPERADATPAQLHDAAAAGYGAAPEALAHSDGEPVQAETSPSASAHMENPLTGAGQEPAPFASPAGTAAAPAVQAIDPDEDPGDLFEPMPGMRPAADAAAPPPVANGAQETAPSTSVAPQSSPSPAGAPGHAASRPAANDPLAPIRALSEEELIALFS